MKPFDRLALAAIIVIWAIHFTIGKVALAQLPPLFLTAVRLSLVVAVLAPFLWRPHPPMKRLVPLAICLGILHYALLFCGLKGLDAGPAAITSQLVVPFSVILAALVFRERFTISGALGVVLAFAGVWLLAGAPRVAPNLGSLFLVGAASLAFAAASIQLKHLGPFDVFVLNAWVAVISAPALFTISFMIEDGQIAAAQAADWRAWASVGFSAVFASIISWGMWYHLLVRYEVSRIIPMTMLVPVLAVVFAVLLRGEPLTVEIVGGGLITLFGVALTHLYGTKAGWDRTA
jgi:O-acetylserine/cysteine efflux transporter